MRKTKKPLPKSPVTRASKGEKFGAVLATPPRRCWETGTVVDYNPRTQGYTVRTAFGVQTDVPRLVRDPGETNLLSRDTVVVLHDELGFTVIDSVLKVAAANPVTLNRAQVSEVRGLGGEDPLYTPQDGAPTFAAPDDPVDVLHGDWVRKSPEGNLVGVLSGGTNVMRSSPFAQVRTHALEDMVEILSHQFRHITAMGDLEIKNDGGKTSLVWRAGADEQTENGANTGNWTLRLDAGASGDMFNFEVTTPKGQTLARIHMSADGRMELYGAAGVDITSGDRGDALETVAANKAVDVRGSMTTTVVGAVAETLGAKVSMVSSNDMRVVGNDLGENVGNNRNAFVGGSQRTSVQGGVKLEVLNGNVETVTANPAAGALPLGKQSQNFVNYAPNSAFNFVVQPSAIGGKFTVVTAEPASVLLGATGTATPNTAGGHDISAVAAFGAMKYEPFLAMFKVLLTLLDNHVHPTTTGPSGRPLVPFSQTVNPMLDPIRSVRVMLGL